MHNFFCIFFGNFHINKNIKFTLFSLYHLSLYCDFYYYLPSSRYLQFLSSWKTLYEWVLIVQAFRYRILAGHERSWWRLYEIDFDFYHLVEDSEELYYYCNDWSGVVEVELVFVDQNMVLDMDDARQDKNIVRCWQNSNLDQSYHSPLDLCVSEFLCFVMFV